MMTKRLLSWSAALPLAAALFGTGCAAPPAAPEAATQTAAAPAADADAKEVRTGSRLARSSTERSMRSINNAGARDMDRSAPPRALPGAN